MFTHLQRKIAVRSLRYFVVLALFASHSSAFAQKACSVIFRPEAVQQLIAKSKERPTSEKIEAMDPEAVWKYLEPKVDAPERDPRFFKVLEASTLELLKNYSGEEIFFVARDGEWFYDAMITVLRGHAKTDKLTERIHLLNLSRPVANLSDPKTLIRYLMANGLDPARIMTGETKVLLIDTGERGSIFISLLKKIITTYKFDPVHWKDQIRNLLLGFEVKLLHSNHKENKASIQKQIEKLKEFDAYQISNIIEDLGFGTIIADRRKELGIPVSHSSLHDWIVETFERRLHWTGRASKISSNGDVTLFENNDNDRATALYNQAQILDYFANDSILGKFSSALAGALASCGNSCSKPVAVAHTKAKEKKTQVQSITAIKIVAGVELSVGQVVVTKSKAKYQVLKFIDEGKRGRVYQVKSLEDDSVYALKVAVDKSSDTLKSFSEEAEKNKGYKAASMPHAEVIELGTDFMVKEFVKGVRADTWLQEWTKAGKPSGTQQVASLRKQLKLAAARGIYIGDLNPKNLIWVGKKWIVVDSGTWRSDLSESEILKRYDEKVVGRWTKEHSSSVANALRAELKLIN